MKDSNQMAPHIRKTVEEIDGDILGLVTDIQKLKDTRATLVDLYGGATEIPAVQTPRPATKAKPANRGGQPTTAPGSGQAPSSDTVKLLSVTRSAPEPFTANSLAVASGFTSKFCANALWKWEQKEILTKVGRGEYRRAPQFPAEAPKE